MRFAECDGCIVSTPNLDALILHVTGSMVCMISHLRCVGRVGRCESGEGEWGEREEVLSVASQVVLYTFSTIFIVIAAN